MGLTRVYVGAHFPLDIAGGAALGLAVNAAAGLRSRPAGPRSECRLAMVLRRGRVLRRARPPRPSNWRSPAQECRVSV